MSFNLGKLLSPLMLPLILIPFMLYSSACAENLLLYTLCNASETATNYTKNSKFEHNLKSLLQLLSVNTPISGGFFNTSVGNSPDRVYGLALCRGDVNHDVCQSCVQVAEQQILKECQSNDAIIWYEYCQIQYSYRMFFSSVEYTGKYPDWWNDQQKKVSGPFQFDQVLVSLIHRLSLEAAFNPKSKKFSTGKERVSGNVTIYGLVQCTWDVSPADCRACFDFSLGDLKACCYSREGGTILGRNCNIRFGAQQFYNSSSSSPSDETLSQNAPLDDSTVPIGITLTQQSDVLATREMPIMDLASIKVATDNFSDSKKLGQGGFGTVYEGVLPDGKEIAVKRLSRKSWQGLEEFKNEIILIAKLQHRNLVRLLGCGLDGEEKLLIYEYMPNKSLDCFIFDSERRSKLNWGARRDIIEGIARGLLYLHEDSRLKIIHRDLKPNNVLLDIDMVAKISDFGMARIFSENQNIASTRRIVGTYGYMAPEYAMEGLFSVKSDVFSFGVILLEIISGKKNSEFHKTECAETLLSHAWRLWNEEKELELIDPLLPESCPADEVKKCIHIGLLCVQEDPADRPKMSPVVALLGSGGSSLLPTPKQPPFSVGRVALFDGFSPTVPSINELTTSSLT
ncbi:Gnk2-homologous domain [Dillenia turbinata]|uniref:non-specific serine/threonine protein kinase n=1 Tax=Dillenia turbinata TaxID=194707 RepID=A0AAN8ZC28_9MAGN